LEAYCVKCKVKREMKDPVAEFTATGVAGTRGVCPVCGTTMYKLGRTAAHEGLTPPAKSGKSVAKSKNGKNGADKPRHGKLVIVESPAKARTVGRFLGKGYTVRASVGHVRDLLRSELSVDIEHDFAPKYRVPNEKRPVVKELKALAREAEHVYLATDPDREGEAIAWHLLEAAEIDPAASERVVFHEITEPAIAEAFSHPRQINMDLVDAQQARRILDRLVGYSISPLLWQKVRSRLSAGRVQSVALRLIVEREREIESFVPVEYWSIQAELTPDSKNHAYLAKLVKIGEADPDLKNQGDAQQYLADLEKADYVIGKIRRSERRRKPAAPFITSTLQQEASRKLGFTARRTMMIAQQLYEGLDVGEGGAGGLITYMRTDSTNVAQVAQQEAREFVKEQYGSEFLPASAPQYKTRAVSAQEAHEAIRPTSVFRHPDKVKAALTPEQFKLYQLVWQRFVASQMVEAVYDTLTVEITARGSLNEYLFRSSGSTLKFSGFLVVYEEAQDEDYTPVEGENIKIPAGLTEGQTQKLIRLLPEQHFTQPPPRYTEASLVQILEEYGIGRPSTYAPILSTIQQRGYVVREAKRLSPTDTGIHVNDLMMDYFPDIVDYKFTSRIEENLDEVASGEKQWQRVIAGFYRRFEPELKKAQTDMPVFKSEPEKVGRLCPVSGHELIIRWGRFGKFIGCSNFPTCRYTEPLLEKIDVKCPKDGGDLVMRKTRKGKVFYGCANYPECDFTSWKRPVSTPCPNCGGLLVINNKREVQCMSCQNSYLMEQLEIANPEQA
jgi:DNA topoisomerase-1